MFTDSPTVEAADLVEQKLVEVLRLAQSNHVSMKEVVKNLISQRRVEEEEMSHRS